MTDEMDEGTCARMKDGLALDTGPLMEIMLNGDLEP
jgi:hypothetical protein